MACEGSQHKTEAAGGNFSFLRGSENTGSAPDLEQHKGCQNMPQFLHLEKCGAQRARGHQTSAKVEWCRFQKTQTHRAPKVHTHHATSLTDPSPPSHQQTPQINHCKGDSTQWWRHFKKLNWPQSTLQGRFRRKERVTTRGASDLNPHGGRVP